MVIQERFRPVGQNFAGKNAVNWALLVQKATHLLRPAANATKTRLGRKIRHFEAVGTENYPFLQPRLGPCRPKISKILTKAVGQKLGHSDFRDLASKGIIMGPALPPLGTTLLLASPFGPCLSGPSSKIDRFLAS
jgi:hypothetical protein